MGQVFFGTSGTSDFAIDIHASCTTQECTCDNVTKTAELSNFRPGIDIRSGRLREIKNKRKLQTVISKTWSRSPTRGGRLREIASIVILTGKILVFRKSGRSRAVVAYERWSQGEVRQY